MQFEILFWCPTCEELVEGRFHPADEHGVDLTVTCEKCKGMVGEYQGQHRNKCSLCGAELCHVTLCTECKTKMEKKKKAEGHKL